MTLISQWWSGAAASIKKKYWHRRLQSWGVLSLIICCICLIGKKCQLNVILLLVFWFENLITIVTVQYEGDREGYIHLHSRLTSILADLHTVCCRRNVNNTESKCAEFLLLKQLAPLMCPTQELSFLWRVSTPSGLLQEPCLHPRYKILFFCVVLSSNTCPKWSSDPIATQSSDAVSPQTCRWELCETHMPSKMIVGPILNQSPSTCSLH